MLCIQPGRGNGGALPLFPTPPLGWGRGATLYYLYVAFIPTVHAYCIIPTVHTVQVKLHFRNVLPIPPGKIGYQTSLTKFNFFTKSNNKQQAFGNTNAKMT